MTQDKRKKSLIRFRQDLRIFDNTAFFYAAQESVEILPVFVLDKKFLDHKEDKRLWFLYAALEKLSEDIQQLWGKLTVLYGEPAEEIQKIAEAEWVDAVYHNRSYGTWREKRDSIVHNWCLDNGVEHKSFTDYLLLDPSEVEQRKVYTPFYKKRIPQVQERWNDRTPLEVKSINQTSQDGTWLVDWDHLFLTKKHQHWPVHWIREYLRGLDLFSYDQTRNIPANQQGTTRISPYLKFWLLSPRETYAHFSRSPNEGHDIVIKELGWREFWQHIMHYFPYVKESEFQAKRRTVKRENNNERFNARKEWKTWYPLVDAAMRQLKQENRMHNRVRMVVASFLTKDLLIDRRWWEAHFAKYLLDYDRNINIWNWQRSASVWPDPKPLRIFNPILQSKRFDPWVDYILKYVPELEWQPLGAIHDPIKYSLEYHKPIMDHYVWSKEAKIRYNASRDRYLAEQTSW